MLKFIKKLFNKKSDIELFIKYNSSISHKANALGKMGLYKTLLSNPDYRDSYAYIVALYACGYKEQAESILLTYKESKDYQKYYLDLAISLLPFAPEVSYDLLENENNHLLLKANISATLSKKEVLKEILSTLTPKMCEAYPEFYLLSNYFSTDVNQHLKNLNAYLSRYNLEPIFMRNSNSSLSVKNLKSETKSSSCVSINKLPLVSIVMTSFNSQEYILSSVYSMINQTYPNKEIIIVDDNSRDETVKLIQELARKYDFIRLVQLERNVGTYVAKTIGTYLSKGEYITNHDSDDWAHPRKIELQIEPLLKNSKLVVSFSKWVRLQDNGIFYARAVSPLTRLNPSSALFRKKEVIKQTGLWDLVRTGADSEFNARLKLVFKNRYVTINKPLTIGAHRPDSLMTSKETGYSADGKSLTRLLYWEAWNYWHIEMFKKKLPLKMCWHDRSFSAPKNILVDYQDILYCLNQFGILAILKRWDSI